MVQNPRRRLGRNVAARMTTRRSAALAPATPSQTAWAVLGLLAAGDTRSDSVAKGVRWLVERQHEDGQLGRTRCRDETGESYYTGTGFPRVFYLGYHLYKQYFPLLALTTYTRAMEREADAA